MDWMALLFVVMAALVAWLGYRTVKGRPDWFSKENLGKSFQTTAVLALLLIGFIAILVLLLRASA